MWDEPRTNLPARTEYRAKIAIAVFEMLSFKKEYEGTDAVFMNHVKPHILGFMLPKNDVPVLSATINRILRCIGLSAIYFDALYDLKSPDVDTTEK